MRKNEVVMFNKLKIILIVTIYGLIHKSFKGMFITEVGNLDPKDSYSLKPNFVCFAAVCCMYIITAPRIVLRWRSFPKFCLCKCLKGTQSCQAFVHR